MAERRYTLVFAAALATAAAATFGVWRVLDNTRQEARIPTRAIVVAARDMPEGSPLDAAALTVRQWPAATVPANAFDSPDSLIGRVTRVPVFTGEPLVGGRLAPIGSSAGLQIKIAPGRRAMSVRINDVAGIAGLLQPNSRVDVLVTLRDDLAQGRQVAKLFMENMRVLSVGTQFEPGSDGRPINAATATLEVSPDEAERLAIASNTGSIQLVLRGYGDPNTVRTTGAVSSDVMAQLRNSVPPAAAPGPAPESRPAARRAPARASAPAPVVVYRPSSPPAAAPVARDPDTVTVSVYRGDKVSQQKFVKPDSSRSP
jgi:pilus assembly protein CpaB